MCRAAAIKLSISLDHSRKSQASRVTGMTRCSDRETIHDRQAAKALAVIRSGVPIPNRIPIFTLGILRRLIARGDMNGIPLAERAINEYWDVTLEKARTSGLRVIQLDVLEQRNAVLGVQRAFAEAVNDYIEKKLKGE
jgi:hypothetical protein